MERYVARINTPTAWRADCVVFQSVFLKRRLAVSAAEAGRGGSDVEGGCPLRCLLDSGIVAVISMWYVIDQTIDLTQS